MSNPRVLIVEDDISIGVVVSAALAAENIDTQICDTRQRSGRRARQWQLRFDAERRRVERQRRSGNAEGSDGQRTRHARDHHVGAEHA